MKMRTGFLAALGKVEVKEFEVPEVDEDSVLIQVKAAGVCGSDFHAFQGSHPFRKPPMILGHEAAGDVVKIGAKVKYLQVGDRVTVEPVKTCGSCPACLQGQYNLCPEKIMAGVQGWLGTFAEYFVIQAQRVHKLAAELNYDLGVLAEPLAVAAHAIKLAELTSGSTCVVLGTGTIGLLAGVAAQEAGAERVYCTDINLFRLKTADKLGLYPLKADEVSVEDIIQAAAPEGADVVFLALSSAAVFDQAIHLVKRGGKVIVIAVFSQPIMVDMNSIQVNEIQLKGSNIYTKEDFKIALQILVHRKADLGKAITHHIHFEELSETLAMLGDPQNTAIKVIVVP